MALYPDVSPSAPVTRDDLARIIAYQQMMDESQGVASSNPGAGTAPGQGTQSFGDMLGMNTNNNDFMSGAPPGNSMFGNGDRTSSLSDFGGAMTTADAAMTGGRASTAGSGELGPLGTNNTVGQVNPFSEGAATGRFGFGDTQNSPFGGRGGGKEGFGEAITVGTPTPTAPTVSDMFPEGAPPAPTGWTSTSMPSPPGGPIDVFASGRNEFFGSPPAGNLFEGQSFNPMAGARTSPQPSTNLPEMDIVSPGRQPGGGRTAQPGGPTPSGGGGVSTGSNAPGGAVGGWGGGVDMTATGGYEGSASVGNTTGAAGFTSPGGGSGFGNVGGSQGSYGSYAGDAPSGFSASSGGFTGFGATGGYDPGGSSFGSGSSEGVGGLGSGGGDTSGSGGGMGGSDGSSGGDNSGGSSGVG